MVEKIYIQTNLQEYFIYGCIVKGIADILDLISTRIILNAGGVEVNPFGVLILDHYGFIGMVFMKILFFAIGTAIMWWGTKKYPMFVLGGIWFINGIMFLVLVINFGQLIFR